MEFGSLMQQPPAENAEIPLTRGDTLQRLPKLPDRVTPESTYAWIEQAISLMDPKSKYRQALQSTLERQRFRKLRGLPYPAVDQAGSKRD